MSCYVEVLFDARELRPGRMTGIGRMLSGLVTALVDSPQVERIVLAGAAPALTEFFQGLEKI
jgi:hypothetical protein